MSAADFYGLAAVIFSAKVLPKSWALLCALAGFSIQAFLTFTGGA